MNVVVVNHHTLTSFFFLSKKERACGSCEWMPGHANSNATDKMELGAGLEMGAEKSG